MACLIIDYFRLLQVMDDSQCQIIGEVKVDDKSRMSDEELLAFFQVRLILSSILFSVIHSMLFRR